MLVRSTAEEEEAREGCSNYMDNMLAKTKDEEEHVDPLRRICLSYQSHGLLINPAKTKLFQKQVTFLGSLCQRRASALWRREPKR